MVREDFKVQYTHHEKVRASYEKLAKHLSNFYDVSCLVDGPYSIKISGEIKSSALLKIKDDCIELELTTLDYVFAKQLSKTISIFEDENSLKEENIETVIFLSGR